MGRDLQEDIDIGLSRSTDGGRSWEPVRVIMDMGEYNGLPQEQNGCSDPGIIVDGQTGEIFCFAVWMNGKPGKHQWTGDGSEPGFEIGKSAQFLMVRSRDDGRTWSKPENLTRTLKKPEWWLFAPSPQQGINLPDGTLVMPAQGRDAKGKEFSTVMTSRDHGRSWTVGTPAYSGGSECQAAKLGDGSIMLNMRNEHERFRAVFVTRDLGHTWQAHPTNRNTLIEPNCNGSLLRVDLPGKAGPSHVLLFANPHSQDRADASDDPGQFRRRPDLARVAPPAPRRRPRRRLSEPHPGRRRPRRDRLRRQPGAPRVREALARRAAPALARSSWDRTFSAIRKLATTLVCTCSSTTGGSPSNRA